MSNKVAHVVKLRFSNTGFSFKITDLFHGCIDMLGVL